MTKSTYPIALILSALALLGPISPASAEERPFRLAGEGSLLFDPQQTLQGEFAASGVATHLGGWTNTGFIAFTPVDKDNLDAVGGAIFVAANGDELWMEIEGSLNIPTGLGSGTFTIIGGTGRFAGASGSTDLLIIQDQEGNFAFTLVGKIDH